MTEDVRRRAAARNTNRDSRRRKEEGSIVIYPDPRSDESMGSKSRKILKMIFCMPYGYPWKEGWSPVSAAAEGTF